MKVTFVSAAVLLTRRYNPGSRVPLAALFASTSPATAKDSEILLNKLLSGFYDSSVTGLYPEEIIIKTIVSALRISMLQE